VLAGVTAGTGLLATYLWTGPLVFVIAVVVLEATVAPLTWTVLTDLGHPARGVVLRTAPAVAIGVLAMIGLAESLHGWCFAVAALVLATSPLVRRWVGAGRIGTTFTESVSPRVEMRRRFDEIVAGFRTTDDDLPPV